MKSIEKLLINYIKKVLKVPEDVEINISEIDKGYRDGNLTFNVDLSKIDKNSSSYDENYATLFRKPKLKGIQAFTYDWSNKIERAINEFKKVTTNPSPERIVFQAFVLNKNEAKNGATIKTSIRFLYFLALNAM